MIRGIILLALLLLAAFASFSYSTDVSGDVWREWAAAGNPYSVVGDLRVPPNSSLVIGPGCYIEFQGYYQSVIDTSASTRRAQSFSDCATWNRTAGTLKVPAL